MVNVSATYTSDQVCTRGVNVTVDAKARLTKANDVEIAVGVVGFLVVASIAVSSLPLFVVFLLLSLWRSALIVDPCEVALAVVLSVWSIDLVLFRPFLFIFR